jgi:hypothetical protein
LASGPTGGLQSPAWVLITEDMDDATVDDSGAAEPEEFNSVGQNLRRGAAIRPVPGKLRLAAKADEWPALRSS